ncbi:usg protein [Ancylobacter mangrovi]|uniref:usg protein n=1 Tax=Ancylobacter mangrovi TaxID=2972472 RepID=UPI0021629423|nr:usg protein [Ancylobacter mangrovi]MCS0504589.1 usg protein [Ancylobacter mangrovi]
MAFHDASKGPAEEAGSPQRSASADFVRQWAGYGLTTAQIFYRMPDHPGLLQTYLWQHYDLCPHFPELNRFLEFWKRELDGPLHSVTVTHSRLIQPAELRSVDGMFRLN